MQPTRSPLYNLSSRIPCAMQPTVPHLALCTLLSLSITRILHYAAYTPASCTMQPTLPHPALCSPHSRILHCPAFSPASCTVQHSVPHPGLCILYSVYAIFNIVQFTHINITLPSTCSVYNKHDKLNSVAVATRILHSSNCSSLRL
jgi:hypothetical protein